MNYLTVNASFQRLCRKLSVDEYRELESSILHDGCRDAIVTWKGTIVDGHNRYEICQKHSLPFKSEEHPKGFVSDEDCLLWIIGNQLGRRNLNDLDRVALVEVKRPILERQAKERMKTSTGGSNPQLVANLPQAVKPERVRDQLAKEAGVSGKTYAALKTINDKGSEDLKQAVRDKKISASAGSEIAKLPAEEQKTVVETKKEVAKRIMKVHDVSTAMVYANMAVAQLSKISHGDKSRIEALDFVTTWIERNRS